MAALLAGFAAYRVGRLLALDGITEPLRDRLNPVGREDPGFFGKLVVCPFCVSWWAAVAAVAVWAFATGLWQAGIWEVLVTAWAAAGLASILVAADVRLSE